MRRLIIFTLTVATAAIFAGCETTAPNTNNARNNVNNNSNTNNMTVVPTNNNANANNNANNTTSRWNRNITKEEYEKDKANYSKDKRADETIGSGVNDGWLWFKTRSALMTTDDLRDSTINVDVNNGVITLKGTVATAEQKKAAVAAANEIEGKTGAVKDMLTVKKDDSALTSTTDSDKKASPTATKKP